MGVRRTDLPRSESPVFGDAAITRIADHALHKRGCVYPNDLNDKSGVATDNLNKNQPQGPIMQVTRKFILSSMGGGTLLLLSEASLAQQAGNGTITFGSTAAAIPSLGSVAMIALALLLAGIGWMTMRSRQPGRFHPLIIGMAGAAIFAMASGERLLSTAIANGLGVNITQTALDQGNGRFTTPINCPEPGVFRAQIEPPPAPSLLTNYTNTSNQRIQVLELDLPVESPFTISGDCQVGRELSEGESCALICGLELVG